MTFHDIQRFCSFFCYFNQWYAFFFWSCFLYLSMLMHIKAAASQLSTQTAEEKYKRQTNDCFFLKKYITAVHSTLWNSTLLCSAIIIAPSLGTRCLSSSLWKQQSLLRCHHWNVFQDMQEPLFIMYLCVFVFVFYLLPCAEFLISVAREWK